MKNNKELAEEFKITEYVHRFLETRIRPGDLCVDATMGNGVDTEFLCRCVSADMKRKTVGSESENYGHEDEISGSDRSPESLRNCGNVLAFDIQRCALDHTKKRLESAGLAGCARLILDSHENMDRYIEPASAKVIMFNLGYLPGGDHSIATRTGTTLEAAEKSLDLLVCGGVLSILIYCGGDSGYGEKDAVLAWAEHLDPKKYLVIRTDYLNRPGDPPIPLFILRMN